ncbi:hypothetical protein AKJ57_05235 [candidate division MSBL1 archaeon SCGC-AAA259A05]|uniref:Protein export membrane protein SecD/SecF C-terminal domain-containing protein n=1 Tax=candidate division MSBL1 archaeon SCGC-AAA259A05 TaxID=1698259 RepID=A0A133U5M4_9EURY|nr:hypothetical protein AKJ57_05235 [candidate division MSBL1 archaeon SCGC-AAA259A05]
MNVSWPVENLTNKQLIAIPLIAAAFFAAAIVVKGVPIGMEFSGGTYIEISNIKNIPSSTSDVEHYLEDTFGGEVKVYQTGDNQLEIETSLVLEEEDQNELQTGLNNEFGISGDYSIPRQMESGITSLYRHQAQLAVIAAAIIMGVILFLAFRGLTIALSILSIIGLDALGIFGCMTLLEIPLSLTSMAGILLIFGYAVNTNVLLSTRVLKRFGGTVRERAADAMRTGVAMSATSATALIALNIVATPSALKQLSAVIVIGILVDMMNTWFLNSGIIMRHAKGKKEGYHGRI